MKQAVQQERPPETANAFMGTLTTLRRGRTVTELTESLQQLVSQVRVTGKAGVLTLKIKVTPGGKDDDAVVVLSDSVDVKLPKMQTIATIMYADDSNLLTRDDPRQTEMPLRSVEGGKETYTLNQPPKAVAAHA